MKRSKMTLLTGILAGAICLTACSDDEDDGGMPLPDQDRHFVVNAAYGNRAEVELGQLAVSKGSTDAVRAFGQMMVQDHNTAQAELEAVVSPYHVIIPDTPDSTHLAIKQQLEGLSGRAFDSAYIHGQVADHQATIALFQAQAANGEVEALRSFANGKLPALEMHLHHADSIAAMY